MSLLDQISELLQQRDGGNPLLPGQTEAGNIDLSHRPSVPNPEGGLSTVFSESSGQKGLEVLYPRVVGGKVLSSDEAWDHYKRTGQHLGKFSTRDAADEMGQRIHRQQEQSPFVKNLLRSMRF
jgi:hypothetical protein